MSEESENNEEGTPIPGELAPHEERASSNGWRPLEEWEEAGNDPEDWVDAKTFNVKGELMGRIQGMGRKLNSYEKEIAELRERQKKHADVTRDMVESTYKKAISDLTRQRREAMEVGDYDAVEDLDERRDELKDKAKALNEEQDDAPAAAAPAGTPDLGKMHPIERTFFDIINSDPTLAQDVNRRTDIGRFADEIWSANPDISTLEFSRRIDAKLNPVREQVPGPRGTSERRSAKAKSKYGPSDLDEMEKNFADTFVATGAYATVQEYIDDAAKSGSLSIQQR